jgi:hypothetical protein
MVTINNEDLKSVYHYLATIDNVIQKEIRHVNGNKSYLDKMVPEQLSKVYSSKEKTALTFVDNLTRTAYDNSVIALCATFERIVFAKYRTTYGNLKTVVKTNAQKPLDYFDSREKFINDGIEYLSGIIYLLEGKIDNDLIYKLKAIKDHRNYIAHGKRDSVPPAVEYPIDVIASTLDDVVREIEK